VFVWAATTGMLDLGGGDATNVNNGGQVVGFAVSATGDARATLWTVR
jgi:hypothetical protein